MVLMFKVERWLPRCRSSQWSWTPCVQGGNIIPTVGFPIHAGLAQ